MTAGAPRLRVVRAAFPVQPWARAIVGCDVRHAAFVRAERDGRVGFGECAPLAGVHAENFDAAAAALERLVTPAQADALPPSARFAVSCALETLDGLGTGACPPVPVAAFFPGGAVDRLDALRLSRSDSRQIPGQASIGAAQLLATLLQLQQLLHIVLWVDHAAFSRRMARTISRRVVTSQEKPRCFLMVWKTDSTLYP